MIVVFSSLKKWIFLALFCLLLKRVAVKFIAVALHVMRSLNVSFAITLSKKEMYRFSGRNYKYRIGNIRNV